MKPQVFYHVGYDEIWVSPKKNRIERGSQANIKCKGYDGEPIEVPDGLSLFYWDVDPIQWKLHQIYGWLVSLGDL